MPFFGDYFTMLQALDEIRKANSRLDQAFFATSRHGLRNLEGTLRRVGELANLDAALIKGVIAAANDEVHMNVADEMMKFIGVSNMTERQINAVRDAVRNLGREQEQIRAMEERMNSFRDSLIKGAAVFTAGGFVMSGVQQAARPETIVESIALKENLSNDMHQKLFSMVDGAKNRQEAALMVDSMYNSGYTVDEILSHFKGFSRYGSIMEMDSKGQIKQSEATQLILETAAALKVPKAKMEEFALSFMKNFMVQSSGPQAYAEQVKAMGRDIIGQSPGAEDKMQYDSILSMTALAGQYGIRSANENKELAGIFGSFLTELPKAMANQQSPMYQALMTAKLAGPNSPVTAGGQLADPLELLKGLESGLRDKTEAQKAQVYSDLFRDNAGYVRGLIEQIGNGALATMEQRKVNIGANAEEIDGVFSGTTEGQIKDFNDNTQSLKEHMQLGIVGSLNDTLQLTNKLLESVNSVLGNSGVATAAVGATALAGGAALLARRGGGAASGAAAGVAGSLFGNGALGTVLRAGSRFLGPVGLGIFALDVGYNIYKGIKENNAAKKAEEEQENFQMQQQNNMSLDEQKRMIAMGVEQGMGSYHHLQNQQRPPEVHITNNVYVTTSGDDGQRIGEDIFRALGEKMRADLIRSGSHLYKY